MYSHVCLSPFNKYFASALLPVSSLPLLRAIIVFFKASISFLKSPRISSFCQLQLCPQGIPFSPHLHFLICTEPVTPPTALQESTATWHAQLSDSALVQTSTQLIFIVGQEHGPWSQCVRVKIPATPLINHLPLCSYFQLRRSCSCFPICKTGHTHSTCLHGCLWG